MDECSQQSKSLGAEIAVGDLLDFASVRAALEGVQRAYFLFPIQPGIDQATSYCPQAAKEAQLEANVNMSQGSARREAKSHAAQDHWIAERVFDWSGLTGLICGPHFSRSGFSVRPLMIKAGLPRLPFGAGRHAPVAADDQARVIAAILENPEPHGGKTYPLYGPLEMTHDEITKRIGKTLGKDVRYEQVNFDTFREGAHRSGRTLSPFFAQHLCEVAIDHQNGVFAGTNDLIETIGGFPPITIQGFVAKHRNAYV